MKVFMGAARVEAGLEGEVNEWLEANPTAEIVDLHYTLASAQGADERPQETHAVLLVYRPPGTDRPGAARVSLRRPP